MVGSDFFSDVSFLSDASILWIWCHGLSCPSRLSVLWIYALVWRMQSCCIIVMDILWINLHPDTSPTDLSGPGYWHYWPDCVLPYILTTWHAWPMTWPLNIIMIMHELLNKLKTSVHWSILMSPMKLQYDHVQHGWSGTSTGRMVREKIIQLAVPY